MATGQGITPCFMWHVCRFTFTRSSVIMYMLSACSVVPILAATPNIRKNRFGDYVLAFQNHTGEAGLYTLKHTFSRSIREKLP